MWRWKAIFNIKKAKFAAGGRCCGCCLSLGSGGKCNFNIYTDSGLRKIGAVFLFLQLILHSIHLHMAVQNENTVPIAHSPVRVDAVQNGLCHVTSLFFLRSIWRRTE